MIISTVSSGDEAAQLCRSPRAPSAPAIFHRAACCEQHHEILHRSAQHRADHDPQGPGKIAELRGERGPDQRSRAGDGREVVAEDDPFVGGLEIVAVAQALGGRGAAIVQRHHLRGEERRVEAVADEVRADRRDHQPQAVDRLALAARDAAMAPAAAQATSPHSTRRNILTRITEPAYTEKTPRRQHANCLRRSCDPGQRRLGRRIKRRSRALRLYRSGRAA